MCGGDIGLEIAGRPQVIGAFVARETRDGRDVVLFAGGEDIGNAVGKKIAVDVGQTTIVPAQPSWQSFCSARILSADANRFSASACPQSFLHLKAGLLRLGERRQVETIVEEFRLIAKPRWKRPLASGLASSADTDMAPADSPTIVIFLGRRRTFQCCVEPIAAPQPDRESRSRPRRDEANRP